MKGEFRDHSDLYGIPFSHSGREHELPNRGHGPLVHPMAHVKPVDRA